MSEREPGRRVVDAYVAAAFKAVNAWDGVDNTDLLELLAAEFGMEFRDLVMDALFRVQVNDTTPVQET